MSFFDEHPFIHTLFIFILIMLFIVFLYGLDTGFKPFHYEYKTIDGDEGVAENCWTDRGEPACRLEDGTIIYNLKETKRIKEEKNE